jgi:ribosomal-protein-serine acetyltransferase
MFSRALRNGIELKLFEHRHAESLFEAVDRDRIYLREWLQWVDPTRSVEDIRNFIKMSLNQFANQEGLAAGIWQGPRCIGSVGSHKIDWLTGSWSSATGSPRSFRGGAS